VLDGDLFVCGEDLEGLLGRGIVGKGQAPGAIMQMGVSNGVA